MGYRTAMIWYDSMLLPYHSFLWWISWNEWDFTGNIDEYSEKITICDMDDIHLAELFSDLLLWPHWNPTDLGHHPMAELLSVLSWCFFLLYRGVWFHFWWETMIDFEKNGGTTHDERYGHIWSYFRWTHDEPWVLIWCWIPGSCCKLIHLGSIFEASRRLQLDQPDSSTTIKNSICFFERIRLIIITILWGLKSNVCPTYMIGIKIPLNHYFFNTVDA